RDQIALLFRSASTSELLINPFFAQFHSVVFGLLFTFEQSALESLNLDNRFKLLPLINNTDGRGAVGKFRPRPCSDDIASVFVSSQRRDMATIETYFRWPLGFFVRRFLLHPHAK